MALFPNFFPETGRCFGGDAFIQCQFFEALAHDAFPWKPCEMEGTLDKFYLIST